MRTPTVVFAALLSLAALGVGVLEYRHHPETILAVMTTDLSQRTAEQRQNIETATRALDGVTVESGRDFSFNAAVGPRTTARGYREAVALMEGNRITSVGGGICQLSSTLYGAAKRAGCPIVRRVPHRGSVQSVPPGEDATVWYGGADLIWRAPSKVTVTATVHGDKLIVAIVRPAG
ncbi:MAG: VanW family protein [Candidatus Sericytochromatia bacterium]|nr:VanW family protein [Candidatus Sericytochromatia bacterium]